MSETTALNLLGQKRRWCWVSIFLVVGCDVASLPEHAPSVEVPVVSEVEAVTPNRLPSDESSDRSTTRISEPTVALKPEGDATKYRMLAEEALQKGNDDVAYEYARKATQISPDDPLVLFVMGRVLGVRHRYDEAIRLLNRVAENDPSARLPSLGQTAQWMVLKGDWRGAEKNFQAILLDLPDAMMAHEELSKLFLRQGRRYEAAIHWRILCRGGIAHEPWLRQMLSVSVGPPEPILSEEQEPIGTLGEAHFRASHNSLRDAISWLQSNGDNKPEEAAFLGRLLAYEDDQKSLENWAEEFRLREPSRADGWFAKAAVHRIHDEHSDVVRSIANAILLDPTDARAYRMYSESLSLLQHSEFAELANSRAEWIERTQEIGLQLLADGDEKSDEKAVLKDELADLLERLQRDDESFAWRTLAIAASEESPGEIQRMVLEVNQKRLRWLKSKSLTPNEEFLLCGVTLRQLNQLVAGSK
ncbi:tetratricopeptide repeat protein [Rhodopirellula halodulae]|uniref:tetratricopeptide repeat protein n=1 Tax=Rhodopirellula halodulae TaxID=2894198 RepID=UPI001E4F02FB|nr:tetratricopeptide repeat protein [Rhodopirellula sp. JC737]MCC9654799.1 tetratricopeptide repeat protein [Rhodopirellula sp. JC737]